MCFSRQADKLQERMLIKLCICKNRKVNIVLQNAIQACEKFVHGCKIIVKKLECTHRVCAPLSLIMLVISLFIQDFTWISTTNDGPGFCVKLKSETLKN